jgi:hypothetical protein
VTRSGGGALYDARMRRLWCSLLLVVLLAGGRSARALDPPGVGLEILPGETPAGVPTVKVEAAAGPIEDDATNVAMGLAHFGAARVDYGEASLESSIVHQLGQTLGLCFPGPCGSALGRWIDTVTVEASGVPNGTRGSLTARVALVAQLEAEVSPGWMFQGTTVMSQLTFAVVIDAEQRDRIVGSCFAGLNQEAGPPPCTLSGLNQFYYPEDYPTTPQVVTPFSDPSGTFELGPWDFTFGTPFTIEVISVAGTSLLNGGNASGTPAVSSALDVAWEGLVRLNDAPGLSGTDQPLEAVTAAAASGVAWLGVAVPEPAHPAATALGVLAAVALRRRRALG